MHKNYKYSFILSIVTLFILLIFAFFFYKQRMFFNDPAFIAFDTINTRSFRATERFGAIASQSFLLAAVYLGLSLKAILIIYSASFYIFYLSVAIIVGWIWKEKWLSILLAFYFTLFVSDLYFWPNNEVHQGMGWMMLFLGLYIKSLKENNNSIGIYFFLVLLAMLAISCHLLVVIPFVFLWLYFHTSYFSENKLSPFKSYRFIIYSILLMGLMLTKYHLSKEKSSYDSSKLGAINDISFQRFFDAFSSGQSDSFLHYLFTNYWLILPLFVFTLYQLVLLKKFKQIGLTFLFAIIYYGLVCMTFPDAFKRNLLFYMESEWAGLSVIITTAFVFHVIPLLSEKKLALLFALIFVIRIAYILLSFEYFDRRFMALDKLVTTLHSKKIHKAIIAEDPVKADSIFIMNWGMALESIMWSKLKDYNPQVTVMIVNKDFQMQEHTNGFYTSFFIHSYQGLNSNYFVVDTAQKNTFFHSLKEVYQ